MKTINDKLKLIHDNGIKIYPKFNINHKFAVTVYDENRSVFKNKTTIGEYDHTTKTINDAVLKTVDYVYEKLKQPYTK